MDPILLELFKIYVINSKKRELKMLNLLHKGAEVQQSIILNSKIDNDQHLLIKREVEIMEIKMI